MGDELRLSHQSVQSCTLLKALQMKLSRKYVQRYIGFVFSDPHLNVRHGQTDQEIHQNNADEHHEEKDHEMSREGKNCISILVDKILIFNFPGHHDESFDQG